MKYHFEDKAGRTIRPREIAAFLLAVKEYRRAGLRKGFAIACAARNAEGFNISQATGHAIWRKRDLWLKV